MNLFTTLHRSDFSVGRIVYVGFVYKIDDTKYRYRGFFVFQKEQVLKMNLF